MKTKLLKKIRKDYSIICFEKLPSDADDKLITMVYALGLPFYFVKNDYEYNGGEYNSHNYCKTYDEALKILWERILTQYKEKFRHDDGIVKKVWWK